MSKIVYTTDRSDFRDYNKSNGKDDNFCDNIQDMVLGIFDCECGVALMTNEFDFYFGPMDIYEGVITDKGKAKFVKKYEYTLPDSVKMKSANYRDYVDIYGNIMK